MFSFPPKKNFYNFKRYALVLFYILHFIRLGFWAYLRKPYKNCVHTARQPFPNHTGRLNCIMYNCMVLV